MKTSKFLFVGILIVVFSLQAYAGKGEAGKFTDPCSPNLYHLGDTINYQMFVKNTDDFDLIILNMFDQFSDTTFRPILPPPTYPIVIPPGGRVDFTTFATVTEPAIKPSPIDPNKVRVQNVLTVQAYHDYPEGPDEFNVSPSRSSIILSPDIRITKEVDPNISKVGDDVLYTIEICNIGDANLTLTDFFDTVLPIDLDYIKANYPDCIELDAAKVDANGVLDPNTGECCTITYTYTIKEGDPDPLVNEVFVTAMDDAALDPNYTGDRDKGTVFDSNSASVDLREACIDITKECDPQKAVVGEEIKYTITITNCSTVENGLDLENVVVTDSLLGVLTEFPTTLAIGDSNEQVYTRTILPTDPNPLENKAEVTATVVDLGNPVDANDSCQVEIEFYEPNTVVDIKANGEDGPITVCEGEQVTLTICEENTGDVDLTKVYVEFSVDGVIVPITPPLDSANPTLTGDNNGDGILQTTEIWCWTVQVTVDANTVYDAIGHGLDPLGKDITIPDYPTEYDEVEVLIEPCGGEGCTPGFWKNNGDKHGASAWCDLFSPKMRISDIFFLNKPLIIRGKGKSMIKDPTLLQALGANGGGVNAMIRHGIAAMLNACSKCVQYPFNDPFAIVFMIEDTLNGAPGAYTVDELHHMFAAANEAGCPVNQHGECVGVEE